MQLEFIETGIQYMQVSGLMSVQTQPKGSSGSNFPGIPFVGARKVPAESPMNFDNF